MIANMHEAKTNLSRLVDRAVAGEDVVIAKAGTPVARLVPYEELRRPRVAGRWAGQVWMAEDFDDTTDELLELFGGGAEADG